MHVRDEGSLGRSAGNQTLRGAALIVAALIIGFIMLRTVPKVSTTVTTPGATTPTTKAPKHSGSGSTSTTSAPSASTTAAVAQHQPSQVSVLVANGAGTAGLAATVRGQLNQAGYNTAKPPINASSNVATTSVYYIAGYQPDAVAIAGVLGNGLGANNTAPMPNPPPVPSGQLSGVDVLVVAGSDLANSSSSNTTQAPAGNTIAPSPTVQSGGSGSTSGTTTTTVRHSTTTAATHTTTTAAAHATTTVPHTPSTA